MWANFGQDGQNRGQSFRALKGMKPDTENRTLVSRRRLESPVPCPS